MKRLLLLAPLALLTSCSSGRKITQLSCNYEPAIKDIYGIAPEKEAFIFDAATGEAFEYSDFYEKLKSIEGVSTDEYGGEYTYKSSIVNDVLKINSMYSDKESQALGEGPSFAKVRINLKDLTVESEYQSEISATDYKTDYKVVGSCKYTEPPTAQMHQGK